MQLLEVGDEKTRREFLELPVRLYKNEKNWIRPLDQDIESVFDPKKNKLFRHGEAVRWILKDSSGTTIGRVAAFINQKTSRKEDQPTGGLGFFDCTNDQNAANLLLDACKSWLQERGMEAMDGSINFGDRDRWWGILAEGFDLEPNYCMHYNFPYYTALFENYGFQLYFKQFTYGRRVKEGGVSEKIQARAERLLAEPKYEFRHAEMKNMDKYAEDFRTIYNKAWVKHKGVGEMSKAQVDGIFKKLKPVMDPKIMMFGYYEGEPIAFFLNLPELNQIFKHVNGNLNWWGKLLFVYHKWRGTCKKMLGLVFGVVPAHQGKGIESAMAIATSRYVWSSKSPYLDFEMNWIGDFNPKMMRIAEEVGGKVYKVHHTYRYLFDRSKPFNRCPIIH
ncbi:hypothetical protein [Cesiribacter sp. SM1]|uniref:hypothetical protein n=1 Tax=Cesiribacter sp. SM1 TaxID=2861196 RepID=UPI001CD3F8AB|nr:hypothetical protein [Cesiribacter sp. SM1]